MSNIYLENVVLLSGNVSPATGEPFQMAKARNCTYVAYTSGHSVAVKLELQAPFLQNPGVWVEFFNFTYNGAVNATGASQVSFADSPMGLIRAVSSGQGNAWCGAIIQN